MLKGKLHQGYHQLHFFCVFLERVVGKLSKALSGHNSETPVAPQLGSCLLSALPPPASLSASPPWAPALCALGAAERRVRHVHTNSKCLLWPPPDLRSRGPRSGPASFSTLRLHRGFSPSAGFAFQATPLCRGDCPVLRRMFRMHLLALTQEMPSAPST